MVKEKEKLIWLGVKRATDTSSAASRDVERLRENVEYGDYQDALDNIANIEEHKTYLMDNGFTEFQADSFNSKINANFVEFDVDDPENYEEGEVYKIAVQEELDSYTELKSEFESQTSFGSELETEDGNQAAGVRVHESEAVTLDGVRVPAGAVEVFGTEVHFSQSEDPKTGDGSGSTGDGSLFTVDNFETDAEDNVTTRYDTITFSADVTNNGDYFEYFVASLSEDGDTVDSDQFRIAPGATRTVEFERAKQKSVCHEYKINTAGPITACWVHAGLIQ